MATYETLKGLRIKYLSSDPSDPKTGQVWYNTTSNTLKTFVAVSAWAASGSYIDKVANMATGGPQTAAILGGGEGGDNPTRGGTYDGSAWTSTPDLPRARGATAGAKDGTQSAFWAAGGLPSPVAGATTEEYDGSSWTAGGAVGDNRRTTGSAGSLTAGLLFGGYSPGATANTEEYNGTSWTEVTNMGTGQYYNTGLGTQIAAISYDGNPGSPDAGVTTCEEYDGTNWSSIAASNYARTQSGAHGNTSDAYAYGGSTPPTSYFNTTDHYNGSTWTTSPATMITSTTCWQGTGPAGPSGMQVGGYGPAYPAGTFITQEFNVSTTTVNAGTWSSGGNLGTARSYVGGCGIQTAALAVAGWNGGILGNVEEYNGTAWSEETNLGTTRYSISRGMGTQTAGLFAGGEAPGGTSTASELYNGSSWTATPSLTGAISYASGFGTSTAALICGGANPRSVAVTTNNSYDGSSWTANPATPFTVKEGATAGPSTAGVFAGGTPGLRGSYEINSTTWTAGNNINLGRSGLGFGGGAATQTAAWIAGGTLPGVTEASEHYDGTTWSTAPTITTARAKTGGAGTQATALIFGGGPDSGLTATEEFAVGTPASAANSTITIS